MDTAASIAILTTLACHVIDAPIQAVTFVIRSCSKKEPISRLIEHPVAKSKASQSVDFQQRASGLAQVPMKIPVGDVIGDNRAITKFAD